MGVEERGVAGAPVPTDVTEEPPGTGATMSRWVTPILALLAAAPAAAEGTFEILESDDAHVRVAFTLPAYRLEPTMIDGIAYDEIVAEGSTGPATLRPGSPELPSFTTRIGLPPGTYASLAVVETKLTGETGVRPRPIPKETILPAKGEELATPVARYEPDAGTYARRALMPETVAAVGAHTKLRNLAIVPLHVTPFRYRSGELVVAQRVVVDVRFLPAREASTERLVPVREDAGAEKLYARGVLNAAQSRPWRRRVATPISHALRTRALRRGAGPEAKLHIEANRNELVRVTRSRLASAGWSVTPQIADLRLTTRAYHADSLDTGGDPFVETPIGILVEDANGNGTFDGSDAFVFYAQDAKTQRDLEAPEDRYSWDNVYWLAATAGGGTPMPERAWTPSGGTVNEPTSFEDLTHYEEQNAYFHYTLAEEEATAPTDRRQTEDHLFTVNWAFDYDYSWGDPGHSIARVPFEIHDPVTGSELHVRGSWRGLFRADISQKRFRPALYRGTGAASGFRLNDGQDMLVNAYESILYDSETAGDTILVSLVDEGVNELATERYNDGDLALDWFEITYRRQYVAHEDRLRFTNGGETGRVRWTITGFTGSDVVVLDLANADMPVVIQPETSGSGSVTAAIEDDVAGAATYLAQRLGSVPSLAPSAIELDTPSNLGDLLDSKVVSADYLVVVYDDFVDALTPLVEHRQAKGLMPLVARVSDVYDEFSGGLFNPEAIREFVRYCYRLHPGAPGGVQPMHLLLVGDASEDYYGVVGDRFGVRWSAPNYVPTYMVVGLATDAGLSRPLIATDHWYIANPDASLPEDDLSTSMMVGRLPVANVTETEQVVDKILRYEDDYESDVDQPWRRRGLSVSDDCFSGGLGAENDQSGYTGSGVERSVFEGTSLRSIQTVTDSGLDDFHVETFFLSDMLDSIPELGRTANCSGTPTCNWRCTRQYTRHVFDLDGRFIDRANRGHLFVTYQGHGNRSLISHEYVLMGNGTVGGDIWGPQETSVADVGRLTNIERWPVWFFFACHVAEFERRDEGRSITGDCLAERLLLHPQAGSIASIASTGYEWLTDNVPIHDAVFRGWFGEPYLADEFTNEPGMLLGEVMYGAKLDLLTRAGARPGLVESYVTLGDPALRIDIAPPRFRVWQDQGNAPWEDPAASEPLASGSRLRASDPDAATTLFAARVFDEVPIQAGDVQIGRREDGVVTWIDEADYTITPGTPDPHGSVRSYTMSYTAPLSATDYEYVFSATDYNQRTYEMELHSRVTASFFAADAGRPPRPLNAGAYVPAGTRLRVVLDSPVGIDGDEIQVLVNGEVVESIDTTPVGSGVPMRAPEASKAVIAKRGGLRSFVWQVEAVLPAELIAEGANTLAVSWPGDGEVATRELAVTATARFELDRFFAYPNPFERETDIFYRVSSSADRARVRIYTLTGRLIRTLEQATPTPDLNRIHWDGRDEDGDAVSNGVYFYRLELTRPDGTKSTEQGKLARVVGHQAVSAPPSP